MGFTCDGVLTHDRFVPASYEGFLSLACSYADANNDGFLTYEDFLASYARERPVVLSMLVRSHRGGTSSSRGMHACGVRPCGGVPVRDAPTRPCIMRPCMRRPCGVGCAHV